MSRTHMLRNVNSPKQNGVQLKKSKLLEAYEEDDKSTNNSKKERLQHHK